MTSVGKSHNLKELYKLENILGKMVDCPANQDPPIMDLFKKQIQDLIRDQYQ